MNSSRYHLGVYNDPDGSIDIADWTLEDADPIGYVGFKVAADYPFYQLILYAAPVALPPGNARSLAAGLPCRVVVGQSATTVDDCIYTAGVDAEPPADPAGDPLGDCRYNVEACPTSFSVDLGEMRQVRRIALRGMQIDPLSEGDLGEVASGNRPQFVISSGGPTAFVPVAYVTLKAGVELLELPQPVETRYLSIAGIGRIDEVGSIGVFE